MFEPLEDRELWAVRIQDRQLPVYVVPGKTKDNLPCWLVTPACGLQVDQMIWLEQTMEAVTHFRVDGGWLARPARAEVVMTKCKGITPVYYLKWEGATLPPPEADPEPEKSKETTKFVRYVCNKFGISDMAGAQLLWLRFTQAAVNWMIIERKSLDLNFAVLDAVPYRSNWKQILAAKFPNFGVIARQSDPKFKESLAMTFFGEQMELPEMAAINESGTFSWTLSVTPKRQFVDHVQSFERRQLDSKGQAWYYQRWLKLVREGFQAATAAFRSWFIESSKPVGSLDASIPKKYQYLRWELKEGCVRPHTPDVPLTRYRTRYEPNYINGVRSKAVSDPATVDLPPVPDANGTVDVRESGGNG